MMLKWPERWPAALWLPMYTGIDDHTEVGDSPELSVAGVDPVEESRRRVRRMGGASRTSR